MALRNLVSILLGNAAGETRSFIQTKPNICNWKSRRSLSRIDLCCRRCRQYFGLRLEKPRPELSQPQSAKAPSNSCRRTPLCPPNISFILGMARFLRRTSRSLRSAACATADGNGIIHFVQFNGNISIIQAEWDMALAAFDSEQRGRARLWNRSE